MRDEGQSRARPNKRVLAAGFALLGVTALATPGRLEGWIASDGSIDAVEVRQLLVIARGIVAFAGFWLIARGVRSAGSVWMRAARAGCLLGIAGLVAAECWIFGIWTGAVHPRVRSLDELCAWLTEGDDPYLGERALATLEERVRALDPDDTSLEAMRMRFDHADYLQRHGRVDESIEVLLALDAALAAAAAPEEWRNRVRVGLGVAHLRRGELHHCVQHHNPASCVFPIAGDGVWPDVASATAAIEWLGRALASDPEELSARWLLNLAHMTRGTYPDGVPPEQLLSLDLFASSSEVPRFEDVAAEVGLDTFNLVGGAILDDFDGDGHLDVVTSSYHPCASMHFFRNDGAAGFEDRSAESRIAEQVGGFNLFQTDVDNDGRLDVYAVRGAWMQRFGHQRNSLLHQLPDGTFHDVTEEAGLAERAYPNLAAAWADYDGDGFLDLYVGTGAVNGTWPRPSELFRNRGDLTFEDVAGEAGVTNERDVKALSWGDYDNDGDPDLFVSNYGQPNRLYRNDGAAGFADVAPELGLDRDPPGDFTFACWFWDVDNDGWLDLFVGGYGAIEVGEVAASYLGRDAGSEPLRLHRNDGRGGFVDVSAEMGLGRVSKPMGANFGDVDNDGWLDMYLGTGAPSYAFLVPNALYRNVGGAEFEDVTVAAGVGHLQKGHAVAFGERGACRRVDRDGLARPSPATPKRTTLGERRPLLPERPRPVDGSAPAARRRPAAPSHGRTRGTRLLRLPETDTPNRSPRVPLSGRARRLEPESPIGPLRPVPDAPRPTRCGRRASKRRLSSVAEARQSVSVTRPNASSTGCRESFRRGSRPHHCAATKREREPPRCRGRVAARRSGGPGSRAGRSARRRSCVRRVKSRAFRRYPVDAAGTFGAGPPALLAMPAMRAAST